MSVLSRWSGSSVSHRIHSSFLIAAALPLLLLGGSAYWLVVDRLQDHALDDARLLARDIGMSLYERLLFVSDELRILAPQIGHTFIPAVGDGKLDFSERVDGYVRVGSPTIASFPLSATDLAMIKHRTANADPKLPLILILGSGDARHVVLLAALQKSSDGPSWVGTALNLRHMWETAGAAERPERVCVIGALNKPIYCNASDSAAWLKASEPLLRERSRPRAIEVPGGDVMLTAAWSLYLQPHYQYERWTVVVGVPRTLALHSVAWFDRVFAGVALVALLLAFMMGRRLIQRNLKPLRQLIEATTRLTAGQFYYRVDIRSGDEFQQLGDAFDGMSERIGDQFGQLNSLARLDRELQSATTVEYALEAAYQGLNALLGTSNCALLCQERWRVPGHLWTRDFDPDSPVAHALTDSAFARSSLDLDARSWAVEEQVLRSLLGIADASELRVFEVPSSELVAAQIVVRNFQEDDREHIDRVASVLGISLGNLAMERRLTHQANHDWLSGLPNRFRLGTQFNEWVDGDPHHNQYIGMIVLGVDRFNQINDSLGRSGGDLLLANIGERLQTQLPGDCVVGRLEGDQFVLMRRRGDAAEMLAELNDLGSRVTKVLEKPFPTRLREVRLTATMGAAMYPRDGEDFEAMIQCLDAARYAAKASRRGGLLFYSTGMREALAGRLEIEQALKGAVQNREMVLHYQPVVDATSRRIRSAEALMRWQRPGVGLVMPGGFIDVAEHSGLIAELGNWAIEEACSKLQQWVRRGFEIETVNVNISSLQLADDSLIYHLDKTLRSTGLPPGLLTLEVTETALIGQFEEGVARLKRLRELGVRVLIDDFGTGYASLKYLKMLPVDGLKIDRLFVKDLPDSPSDEAIIAAVCSLARGASMKLVAEGIETAAQADFLQRAGVPYLQGFLFDKGLPADEFEQRLCAQQRLNCGSAGEDQLDRHAMPDSIDA